MLHIPWVKERLFIEYLFIYLIQLSFLDIYYSEHRHPSYSICEKCKKRDNITNFFKQIKGTKSSWPMEDFLCLFFQPTLTFTLYIYCTLLTIISSICLYMKIVRIIAFSKIFIEKNLTISFDIVSVHRLEQCRKNKYLCCGRPFTM